jgi:hypothetical protein
LVGACHDETLKLVKEKVMITDGRAKEAKKVDPTVVEIILHPRPSG